jgi:hypothetical protein
MHELDIQQRFHMLQREVEAAVSLSKDARLDFTAAIDSLRIEVEVLKMFMERSHPEFETLYPKLKEQALQAINPEWMGSRGELAGS